PVGDRIPVGVGPVDLNADVSGVAGGKIDRARGGGAKRAGEEVVAQREVLGVVPHAGDGVAVVVVHDVGGLARLAGGARARPGADARDELVHLAAVKRLLFVGVAVVLIAEQHVIDVCRVKAPRVGLVSACV